MNLRRNGSILGIALEPRETVICQLRRQGQNLETVEHLHVPLAAEVFKSDPAKAGIELRRHLQAARLRPGKCVVCVPLTWAFSSDLELPQLSEADLRGFIELEAERRFPLPLNELVLSALRLPSDQGTRRGLLLGVPAEYIANVETAIKTARLHPVGITFGAAALAEENLMTNCAVLRMGAGLADLAIVGEGALLTLRNLAWPETSSSFDGLIEPREIAKQVRITLAQLPPERRNGVKTAVLYGCDTCQEDVREALKTLLTDQGLSVVEGGIQGIPHPPQGSSALFAAAVRGLRGSPVSVQLLPKHKSRFQAMARFSARKTRWIAAAAAAVALVATAFWLQDRHLAQLERAWGEIGPRVTAAKTLQDQVRQYRSWYDSSLPSLDIPKSLASAFPEDGAVWVKSLQVKDRALATCSGNARSRRDWMQVMEQLRTSGELDDLQVVQTRGDTPFGFTLTFRWKGRDSSGS